MGSGRIEEGGENGLYNVDILYDTETASRTIALINDEIGQILETINEIDGYIESNKRDIANMMPEYNAKRAAWLASLQEAGL